MMAFITCSTQNNPTPRSSRMRRRIAVARAPSVGVSPASSSSSRMIRGRSARRHRQLEQLAPAAGEAPRGHRRVLGHLDEGQQLGGRPARPLAPQRGGGHVLGRGQVEERPRGLERAPEAEPRDPVSGQGADPVLAEADGPRGGPEQPADQVEQRCLAGPVGPDERHDLALGDREAHAREDAEAAEAPGDVRAFEDHPPCACSSSEPPTIMAIASRRIHVNGSWNSRKPTSRTSTVEVPPMKKDDVTFRPRS